MLIYSFIWQEWASIQPWHIWLPHVTKHDPNKVPIDATQLSNFSKNRLPTPVSTDNRAVAERRRYRPNMHLYQFGCSDVSRPLRSIWTQKVHLLASRIDAQGCNACCNVKPSDKLNRWGVTMYSHKAESDKRGGWSRARLLPGRPELASFPDPRQGKSLILLHPTQIDFVPNLN